MCERDRRREGARRRAYKEVFIACREHIHAITFGTINIYTDPAIGLLIFRNRSIKQIVEFWVHNILRLIRTKLSLIIVNQKKKLLDRVLTRGLTFT